MQQAGKRWTKGAFLSAALALVAPGAYAQDTLQVAEAKLGKGVQDRQITEEATTFGVNEKAYLWMRVTGGAGQVKVVWRSGDIADTVTLNVGGSGWRTWSSKTLAKAGEWTVTVTDANDQVLDETSFTVQ
jgi:hypothetical protein